MSFLSPLFLIGALAAAIPLAIHLFHRRAQPLIEFAAMRYLRHAPVEQAKRRRIREMLLLALRVTALVLLALAFARPYLTQTTAALGAPATIVLVDTSVSLSAPGQFDRARDIAREIIRGAPPTHAVGVVAFSSAADVVAPLSRDRAASLAAIDRLHAGAGATRYRAGLVRTGELFGDRPGRIVVVTDLQQTGWDAADPGGIPQGVGVEVRDVEAPAGNLAVISLTADSREAVAIIRSYSTRDEQAQVRFAIDARPLGVVDVALPARGTAEARFALKETANVSGALTATISDPKGYAADNLRFAVLDPKRAPSVVAITASGQASEAFYLERALTVADGPAGFRIRVIGGPSFSDLTADALADVNAIVILGTRGLERHGRDLLSGYVRSGGGVLLTGGPDVDPLVATSILRDVMHSRFGEREASPLAFAPADSRHPVFRVFGGVGTLGNVTFRQSALVTPADGALVLARYSDGAPAVIEEHAGEGRILVFASDLNNRWNDFPTQPAYVPFVHETLRYLASAHTLRTEYLVGELSQPEGQQPGIARRPNGRRVAINVDARESDPARMTADAFKGAVSRLHAAAVQRTAADTRDREEGQRLWQFALLAMVLSLVAEGALGRRLG